MRESSKVTICQLRKVGGGGGWQCHHRQNYRRAYDLGELKRKFFCGIYSSFLYNCICTFTIIDNIC